MASTFTNLAYHIVFSTKYRKRFLSETVQAETYRYIAGIIANKDGQMLEIGDMPDHVHILTSCSPRIALADFVRDIKSNSSKWLHEEKHFEQFGWQTAVAHLNRNVVMGVCRRKRRLGRGSQGRRVVGH